MGRLVHRRHAVADHVDREAEVGPVPGRLLHGQVGGHPRDEHRADRPVQQPSHDVVPGQPGELLVVGHQGPAGQFRHLRNQLGAGRTRPEHLLRVAYRPHEGGVADQRTPVAGNGEPGEDQLPSRGAGRSVELHRPADHATSRDRLTEHPAEETLRLDHIDLPVQRENRGTPWTCHGCDLPRQRPWRTGVPRADVRAPTPATARRRRYAPWPTSGRPPARARRGPPGSPGARRS